MICLCRSNVTVTAGLYSTSYFVANSHEVFWLTFCTTWLQMKPLTAICLPSITQLFLCTNPLIPGIRKTLWTIHEDSILHMSFNTGVFSMYCRKTYFLEIVFSRGSGDSAAIFLLSRVQIPFSLWRESAKTYAAFYSSARTSHLQVLSKYDSSTSI